MATRGFTTSMIGAVALLPVLAGTASAAPAHTTREVPARATARATATSTDGLRAGVAPGRRTVSPALPCPSGALCLWDSAGHMDELRNCGLLSFTNFAVWQYTDNLPTGTVSYFYDVHGAIIARIVAPSSGTLDGPPVAFVRPC
jgi:hypothetical protein